MHLLLLCALVRLCTNTYFQTPSNGGFEFRILSVRGGHYGEEAVRELLHEAFQNVQVSFTQDPKCTAGFDLIVEGPPNLYHLSNCGPKNVPWAQYSAEPGDLYTDDTWCEHDLAPVFRIDTTMKYFELARKYTTFIWAPYGSIVTESFLGGKIIEQRQVNDHQERPYFLAWIASNCESEHRTFALTQMLQAARERNISDFHSLGGCLPNTNIPIPSRDSGWPAVVDIYRKYRFVISFENAIEPGYVTEKLATALAGGAIPVYYGDGYAARKIFPDDKFIDVRRFWKTLGDGYEQMPSALLWRKLLDYLHEVDKDRTRLMEGFSHRFSESSSSVPPELLPFPKHRLPREIVEEISKKLKAQIKMNTM